MITIKVNGEIYQFDSDFSSIDVLLEKLVIDTSYMAIVVNKKIIPRSQHKQFELQQGDEIEMLSPMQGG